MCGCQSDTSVVSANDGNEYSLLNSMSDDDLFAVGITAVDGGRWSIAWSTDSPQDIIAIHDAFEKVNLFAVGSYGHGSAGWYIEKEDFFTAQPL